MAPGLYIHTRFSPTSPNANGGVRRCQQLFELMTNAGFAFANDVRVIDGTASGAVAHPWRGRVRAVAKGFPGARWIHSRVRASIRAHRFASQLDHLPECGTVVWENTLDLFVPEVATALGHRVVATPQNLEALVMRPDGTPRLSEVEPELRALARADEVFCISEEETWLLRSVGIRASCLPYFPPAAIHEDLLRIRSLRAGRRPGERWLMVGTVGNIPTRIGMMEGLAWLGRIARELPTDLDIVGFGTEGLHVPSAPRSFVFHGAVSQARLSELMSSCRGVIVHHAPTSGALTRLVECAVAGIPVVANADATKGQRPQGVSTYHDRNELAAMLSEPLAVPQAPDRPRREEKRFVSALAATRVDDAISASP